MQIKIKCECGNEEEVLKFDNMESFKLVETIQDYDTVIIRCNECGYLENF